MPPAIPAHRLKVTDNRLTEHPERANMAVVWGDGDNDVTDAIASLKRGKEVFWDPQNVDGLRTIRAAFKAK